MARVHDPEAIHARRWRILAVLNLSLVIVVAANSSLNVALPTMVRELRATNAELQWIVDAYALVFAGLLLPMGALGDRFGRKGLLQAGLSTFAVGALVATLATQPWQVIATRGVMGVGAAMIMPATLSIITNVFPARERSKA
ncbi:MAG: MFS transporter, partial [Actinomycetota bacterium]|nr:MFS transporter [Actinomycetota bacterium]